jgi:hypothetical protein
LSRISNKTADELVASVTGDVPRRAARDDLLRRGVVFVDFEDRVQLNGDAFIPQPWGPEQLFYFAYNPRMIIWPGRS